MSYRFTLDEVTYLRSASAVLQAAADLPLTDSSLLADVTALRRSAGSYAAAVAETIRLRRRAAARWATAPSGATAPSKVTADPAATVDPGTWLFTDEALQQASPPVVAAHRATRLAGTASALGYRGVHDLTASIGADLAALAATGTLAIGSDIDPVRLAMARHNLATSGRPAHLTRADARTATSTGLARYADPARRDATGRRIIDTIPSVADLDAADPGNRPILRLPPAIDYEAMRRDGEIEIVSWRGSVREAVSWPPAFAQVSRRASILADDGQREGFTDRDPAQDDVIPAGGDGLPAAGRYLVDPDPAVVRAHLVQQYAAAHDLRRLDDHLAYLTGDTPPPHLRSFEILERARYSEKTVRGWLRRDEAGTLEIKQRGTPIIPDDLRKRLKPTGDRTRQRTLIIARVGRGTVAFWTCAVAPGGPQPPRAA